jgi:hypothetical protein
MPTKSARKTATATRGGALAFNFATAIRELQELYSVARPFLQPSAERVVGDLTRQLENYQRTPTTDKWDWAIDEATPLLTRVSEREFEPGKRAGFRLYAAIDGIWTIKRVADPRARRGIPAPEFVVAGKYSTRVRLFQLPEDAESRSDVDRLLALWRMEVGDQASPGCHFHVQIGGQTDDPPFPHSLPVPRLPSILATPPSVIEYVVGELFQDEWPAHVAARSAMFSHWAGIQQRQLSRLLEWKLRVVSESSASPWTSLKRRKPDSDLFTRSAR